MTCVHFISLTGWFLMLGTVSQTMLYYLKKINTYDLIVFGNIKI